MWFVKETGTFDSIGKRIMSIPFSCPENIAEIMLEYSSSA